MSFHFDFWAWQRYPKASLNIDQCRTFWCFHLPCLPLKTMKEKKCKNQIHLAPSKTRGWHTALTNPWHNVIKHFWRCASSFENHDVSAKHEPGNVPIHTPNEIWRPSVPRRIGLSPSGVYRLSWESAVHTWHRGCLLSPAAFCILDTSAKLWGGSHFDALLCGLVCQLAVQCSHLTLASRVPNSFSVLLMWSNKEGKMAEQLPRARQSICDTIEMHYCYISCWFYCRNVKSVQDQMLQLELQG